MLITTIRVVENYLHIFVISFLIHQHLPENKICCLFCFNPTANNLFMTLYLLETQTQYMQFITPYCQMKQWNRNSKVNLIIVPCDNQHNKQHVYVSFDLAAFAAVPSCALISNNATQSSIDSYTEDVNYRFTGFMIQITACYQKYVCNVVLH